MSEKPLTPIEIGLTAAIVAIEANEPLVLIAQGSDGEKLAGLPFGPFDPDGHRTFEIALREFVTRQTRFELGFVEQLYTFGDKGREAPLADVGAGAARVISVGYLALAPLAVETEAPDSSWSVNGCTISRRNGSIRRLRSNSCAAASLSLR